MANLPRHRKLPIGSLAVVLGSLLVGLTLVPVAAQRAGLKDGAVTVRSDGAVYLIANGQRHWVATVVIGDEELNAYPEADPIYAALVPLGSSPATAGKPSSSGSTGSGSTGSGSGSSASGTAVPTPDPSGRVSPSGDNCPGDHAIKGATVGGIKYYYEPDRVEYPTIKPEDCFTAGNDARNAGYKERK